MAETQSPGHFYTNCPMRRKWGRGGGAPCKVGSPGPGWEWGGGEVPLQPSECEPGLAGAGVQRHRGERRKREPNRKEEAEMGVVREKGRKSKEESRRAGGAGDRGQGGAATEASHPKQPKGKGMGRGLGRGGGGRWGGEASGKGCLGNRAQPPSIPTVQMGRQAREAKASAQGHTARPRLLTPTSEGIFPCGVCWGLITCGASHSKAAFGPHRNQDPEKTHSRQDVPPFLSARAQRKGPVPTFAQSGLEPGSLAPDSFELPWTQSSTHFEDRVVEARRKQAGRALQTLESTQTWGLSRGASRLNQTV